MTFAFESEKQWGALEPWQIGKHVPETHAPSRDTHYTAAIVCATEKSSPELPDFPVFLKKLKLYIIIQFPVS